MTGLVIFLALAGIVVFLILRRKRHPKSDGSGASWTNPGTSDPYSGEGPTGPDIPGDLKRHSEVAKPSTEARSPEASPKKEHPQGKEKKQ